MRTAREKTISTSSTGLVVLGLVLLLDLTLIDPARALQAVITPSIMNSSGASRACVCSFSCAVASASKTCSITPFGDPILGFCDPHVIPPATYPQGVGDTCRYTVGPGGACRCRVFTTSAKKVRLLACMEGGTDGVTPLACAPGY